MTWTPPRGKAFADEPDHVWIQGVMNPRIIRDDRKATMTAPKNEAKVTIVIDVDKAQYPDTYAEVAEQTRLDIIDQVRGQLAGRPSGVTVTVDDNDRRPIEPDIAAAEAVAAGRVAVVDAEGNPV